MRIRLEGSDKLVSKWASKMAQIGAVEGPAVEYRKPKIFKIGYGDASDQYPMIGVHKTKGGMIVVEVM